MADGKVTIDSELNDKGLDKGIKNLQSKLEGAGKKLQSAGGNLTKSLTLPIVAAGTGALLMASKFDDSMRTVKATMGKNLGESTKEAEANFKALREEAMLLGATTAHSASDASGAMKELAQMGYDTTQILASTGTILDVASASGLDLDFVATTLAGSMNQFGVEVDDNGVNIQRFGDVMVRAGQMSGTSMEEIANALEYVGSQAHNSGMDIEQTSAYIGILGDQSIKGSKAGTSLNAMFRDMKGKVKDGNLEFGEFNVAMYDSQGNMRDMTDIMEDLESGLEGKTDAERDAAIGAVFGSQAQTAVNAVLGEGTEKVREYEAELELANDTAKIAAGEMEGGIGGALRGLASASEALAISFGDILVPAIQAAAKFVANLFLKFTELSDGQKKTIVTVLAIIAALGPLLVILGTIIIFVSKVIGVLAAINPVVLIVVGVIAGLIAIGVSLYKNWEEIKEKAIEVFSHFEPLLESVKEAFQKLMESVQPIMESLKTLWESLLPILEKVGAIVGGVLVAAFGILIATFTAVMAALGPVIEGLINFVDFIINMVNVVVALLTGDFVGAWEFLQDAAQSTIDFFVNMFTGLIEFFMTFVNTIVDFFYGLYMTLVGNSIIPDMVNAIVEWFQNMFEWLVEIVMFIVDAVVDAFMTIYETVSDYVTMVLEIIQSIWGFIQDVFTGALDFLKALVTLDFGAMRDAIKSIMDSAKRLLENIWKAIDKFLTKTLGGIWNTIKSIFGSIFSTISSVLSSISGAISSVWSAVSSVTSSVWNGIKNTLGGVINGLKNTISTAFNFIKSTISGVWNGIKSTTSTIWSGIVSAVKAPVNLIIGMINGMINALNGISIKLPKVPDWIPGLGGKGGGTIGFNIPNVPSLDVGTDLVTQDGLATLHKGESVVPAKHNGPYSNSGGDSKQMAGLVKAIEKMASRPASFQIDGVEVINAIGDGLDTNFADRMALDAYLKGDR